MNKDLKINCQYCNGPIAFPKEYTGLSIDCPHCSKQITLIAPAETTQRWLYYDGKKTFGPCSTAQMNELVLANVIHHTTFATRESETERQRISTFPEFAGLCPMKNRPNEGPKENAIPPTLSDAPCKIAKNMATSVSTVERTSFWWPESRVSSGGFMAVYTFLLCATIAFSYITFNEDGWIWMTASICIGLVVLVIAHLVLMAFRCVLFLPKNKRVGFSLLPMREENESVASCLFNKVTRRQPIPKYCFFAPLSGLVLCSMILAFNALIDPTEERIDALLAAGVTAIVFAVWYVWKCSANFKFRIHQKRFPRIVIGNFTRMVFREVLAFGLTRRALITGGCIFIFATGMAGWSLVHQRGRTNANSGGSQHVHSALCVVDTNEVVRIWNQMMEIDRTCKNPNMSPDEALRTARAAIVGYEMLKSTSSTDDPKLVVLIDRKMNATDALLRVFGEMARIVNSDPNNEDISTIPHRAEVIKKLQNVIAEGNGLVGDQETLRTELQDKYHIELARE